MRYIVWSEASGAQQVIEGFDSAEDAAANIAAKQKAQDKFGKSDRTVAVMLAVSEMNDDERKVIADLSAKGEFDKTHNYVMIDTADEVDLLYFARMLGVEMNDDWERAASNLLDDGGDADAAWQALEDLQDTDEGYAQMLAINEGIRSKVRFVALESFGRLHG